MPPTATQPINGFGSIHVEKHGGLQGFGAQTRSSSSQYGVMKKSMRSSGRFHTSTVEDTSVTLQRRVANELGSSFSERVSAVDYTTLVEWIHYERLSSLPKEGSAWDKVLVLAQALAERVNMFESSMDGLANGSTFGANLAYGYSLVLLELGSENSEALDTAFALFNRSSHTLAALFERLELIEVSPETRDQLALAFADLLTLISHVAIRYQKAVKGMATSSMSVDLHSAFGSTINSFRSRCTHISTEMWRYSIKQAGIEVEEGLEPKDLRAWLAPHDHILATIASDHMTLANSREEFTCLWAEPYITNFMRGNEKTLAVTGKAGSGKTVLAGAIFDRLQRPVARRHYATLFASANGRMPAQATSLSIVKSLLLQLLDQRIGNLQLYQALVDAFRQSKRIANLDAYEEWLWKAFSTVVGETLTGAKDLVVLVDGLDEVSGSSAAPHKLFIRLRESCGKFNNVKLITLSQPTAVANDHTHRLDLNLQHLSEDVYAVAHRTLSRFRPFSSKSVSEQDSMVQKIVEASEGSFLWAKLLIKLLERQKSEDLSKALDNALKAQKTVSTLVLEHLQAHELPERSKNILSFLTVAERPLTISELRILLQTTPQEGMITGASIDIMHTLHPIAPLVFVADELVYVRHDLIRRSLDDLFTSKKVQLQTKDRRMDFILRMMTYAKFSLQEHLEPSFTSLDILQVNTLFQKLPILEYVVRYWPSHFKYTPMYKDGGEPSIPQEFKNSFPDSTTFALLEKSCWDTQLPAPLIFDWHSMTVQVRVRTLGENKPATLQSSISAAATCERLNLLPQASTFYYLSARISRAVFSAYHTITMDCATRVLRITESLITSTRTETVTHREEILFILIDAYKAQNNIEMIVQTQRSLATLYTSINEKTNAEKVNQSIKETTKETQETTSTTTDSGEDSRSISVSLRQRTKKGMDIKRLEHSLFERGESDELVQNFDARRIDVLTREADAYTRKGETAIAERTWVELWSQIAEQCRIHSTTEWHERQIQTVMGYSKFLQSQKRGQEASSTLLGLWQEYELNHTAQTKTVIDHLTEVATMMKSVGLTSAALSIFKHAQSYYQSINSQHSSQYSRIQQEMQQTSREVMTSATSTTVSDSVLRELFFSSVNTTHHTIDTSGLESAKILVQRYMEEQRWSEAIKITKSVLKTIWSSFYAVSLDSITLVTANLDDCIDLVQRLATCYNHQRRMDKVEDINVRLFRAVRSSRKVDDALVIKMSDQLIAFYRQRSQTEKLIGVYQELLIDYCSVYGETSKKAIDTMYMLGQMCRHNPSTRNYWIEYYFQIIAVLNRKSEISHPDAMDAMIVVSDYFWDDKRYAESLRVLRVMWSSFKSKPKDYKQFNDQTLVQTFFERYVRGLEDTNVDFATIHQTIVEYRNICIKTYGSSSNIAIQSTLLLAKTCQRNEKYESEAISLYEELLKISSSSVNTSEIRRTLSTLYSQQVRSTSSSGTKSVEIYERAMPFYKERIRETREKYGLAHEETITQLREMTLLCYKQQKIETAMHEVTNVMTEIMTKETSSSNMLLSATSLAQTLKETNQTQRGVELVDEYHRQIVAQDSSNVNKSGLNLLNSSRQSFVFLAALEYHLRNDSSLSFSKIMADITTEHLYYQQFRQSIKSSTTTESSFTVATRLWSFLLARRREVQATHIVEETVEAFKKRESSMVKVSNVAALKAFVVTIFQYLSKHKTQDFIRSVSLAGNERVSQLMQSQNYREACDVATCTFQYVSGHAGYRNNFQHGFMLAMLISGRNQTHVSVDQATYEEMLSVSKSILQEVLRVCKSLNINMAQVQLNDLNMVVGLMGQQRDYSSLETLLSSLWSTREVQRHWRQSVSLSLGRRLICARMLVNRHDEAIRLAEAIVYNLRRVHGSLNLATLDMHLLLAQLYASTALQMQNEHPQTAKPYFRKAATIHEDTLRLLVDSDSLPDGDAVNGYHEHHDHMSTSGSINANMDGELSFATPDEVPPQYGELAAIHFRLLKLAVQRLGSWPKDYVIFEDLNAKAYQAFPGELKGFEGMEKWNLKGFGSGKAESNEGLFVAPSDWSVLPAANAEEEEL